MSNYELVKKYFHNNFFEWKTALISPLKFPSNSSIFKIFRFFSIYPSCQLCSWVNSLKSQSQIILHNHWGVPPFFYLLLFNLCVGWPLLLHSLDLIFIELDFMLSAACSASPQFSFHCVHVTQNTRFSNNSQLDTCSLAITGGKYTITRLK